MPDTVLNPIFHDPEKAMSEHAALAALAAYLPIFTAPGFSFGSWTPPERAGAGVIVMGYFTKSPEARAFMEDAYAYGWVREFAWPEWATTPEAHHLLNDPAALADATVDDLARVLTVCLRQDRFVEGGLNGWFEAGMLTRIMQRAAALMTEQA